ncbi:MAG TPA: GON domain-containing protein [Pseudonocardiaceae bacterium]|jgi:hypothetical protein
MNRTPAHRYLVLLTMLVALFAGAAPATAAERGHVSTPGTGILPSLLSWGSCKDIHTIFPFAPDGTYPLITGNDTLLTVFCYDMAGTPREYIDLAHTGAGSNFAQYTAGGASPGTNVRTSFTKLRIDPATLTVDIGDLTFATSTGRLQHSSVTRGPSSPFVTAMPYGVAMSCEHPGSSDGVADINLQGTPFIVDDTFVVRTFEGSGSATVSPDKKTVALNGGGYCGWISPAPSLDSPFNPQPGDFRLNLACAPYDPFMAAPSGQYCVKLS